MRGKARTNVIRGIVELGGPLGLLPIVDPRRFAAVLEIKHVMAERAKSKEILERGPRLAAKARATDRSRDHDLHRPARCIRLPTTFSAEKNSCAIARAAWQWPA